MLKILQEQKWAEIDEATSKITLQKSKNTKNNSSNDYRNIYLCKDSVQYSFTGPIHYQNKRHLGILEEYVLVLSIQKKNLFFLDFTQYQTCKQSFQIELTILDNQSFKLTVGKWNFHFSAPNNAKQWIFSLNYYIQTAQPTQNIKIPDNFQLEHRINIDQFQQKAETLDIILFKNKAMVSKLQRLFTSSEYDHVAILLKNNQGKLHIFEANSDDGVCIYTWDAFRESNYTEYVDRIAYRKLMFERNIITLVKLQEFISKNQGKKYSASLSKLCKKQSILGVEKENYFCSELVASCYKNLGLIDNSVSACQFWPKTTLQENQLYYSHLKGQCVCLRCKCGQCRCPFSKKQAQTHLKARSLYQREYTHKDRTQSMSFNAGSFPYMSVKQPLEAFQIKTPYQRGEMSLSLKPLPLEKPQLEQFGQQSSYDRAFKPLPLESQEAIRPINSLFLVKNIPNLYKSSYKSNYKIYKPTGHLFDGPMKTRKGLIGCDISFYQSSKYQEEYKKMEPEYGSQKLQLPIPYLQTGVFKGQFETSSKRSFKPFQAQLCPAKQEILQNQLQFSEEKYKMHL